MIFGKIGGTHRTRRQRNEVHVDRLRNDVVVCSISNKCRHLLHTKYSLLMVFLNSNVDEIQIKFRK